MPGGKKGTYDLMNHENNTVTTEIGLISETCKFSEGAFHLVDESKSPSAKIEIQELKRDQEKTFSLPNEQVLEPEPKQSPVATDHSQFKAEACRATTVEKLKPDSDQNSPEPVLKPAFEHVAEPSQTEAITELLRKTDEIQVTALENAPELDRKLPESLVLKQTQENTDPAVLAVVTPTPEEPKATPVTEQPEIQVTLTLRQESMLDAPINRSGTIDVPNQKPVPESVPKPRRLSFPFLLKTTSKKPPAELAVAVRQVLAENGVAVVNNGDFVFHCRREGENKEPVEFNVEVCRFAMGQTYGIKFKRISKNEKLCKELFDKLRSDLRSSL